MTGLYLEELVPGRRFGSASLVVSAGDVESFAAEFAPGGVMAMRTESGPPVPGALMGWQVAGLTMRLLVESELRVAGGLIGFALDELRWPNPAFAGDVIRLESEIIRARASRSRPGQGIVLLQTRTLNQRGAVVQMLLANLTVLSRETGVPPG